MSAITQDQALVRRYTDQPATMPQDVRRRIEASWDNGPVQLYAVADLDASLQLRGTWVALGAKYVAFVPEEPGGAAIRSVKRDAIREVREVPGLSCTQLLLLGDPGEPALATLRYTHRQRRAMENLKFVLEQHVQGHSVPVEDPDEVYASSVAHAVKTAQASMTTNKLAVIWRLLAYMKPYRLRVSLGFLAAIIFTIVNLLPPLVMEYLIERGAEAAGAGSSAPEGLSRVAVLVVACIAAIFVIRQFFAWVRMRSMSILGEYVARDLRTQVYEHLQKLSLSFYSSKQTGSIITRVSSDTDRLWDFLAWGVIDFVLSVTMVVGLGGVLLWKDWRLGLIMTVPLPVLFYAMFRYGRRMHRIFLRCWQKWSNMTAVLADTIPGVRVVKAFNQEQREKHRFDERNYEACDNFNVIHVTWTTFWPCLWMVVHVMMLVVWALAVPRVLGLDVTGPPLELSVFVAFVMFMGMFVQPLEIIGRMTFILNRATSSAHRVFEILDTEPSIRSAGSAIRLDPVEGRVDFKNVTFAYDGVRQVLRNVSFEVEAGEMIGLVGPSGAGKSTVTNLIARFYDVSSGLVRIDGVDVRELDLDAYRRQLGIVLQEPHLFHGSVLDNIRYGAPEAGLDRVAEAAQTANAHDFICRLPQAYDTIVGERGHTLSGGERQRVSIARAILHNPRILILDEATSSVDTETEHKIQEALERLVEGRTVFAIAHRLSTLRRASRLFVIEEGRITECGTHAELLANSEGTYSKLVEMQQQLHQMYVA